MRIEALAAALLVCSPAAGRTLAVGPGKMFALPSQAADMAVAGDRIVIAPGTYSDCANLRADHLVIEGDPAGTSVMTTKICDGKAILVTTGRDITIRNLTLAHASTLQGNGAGIRDESRTLTIDHVRFNDNQDGILTGAAADARLTVRDSIFLRNGACVHACAHGIYAGRIALLHVERSVFSETRSGHHIKSRAARTEIIDCSITDGPNGTSSYLIDIPNGGAVLIRGNTLEKGPRSENHRAAIAIGEEGELQPTPQIVVQENDFRDDGVGPTLFVDNRTQTSVHRDPVPR